ncbi:MAG: hypothetical protein EOO77_00125 [Oxalobacteraceae bacterium]|nr:MAG: hypothetical protein EOO77_00125 [Oxalobacteraceae bacterium]
MSGVERRRHWSDERKLALVEAAIMPGASIAAIARDADVSPSSARQFHNHRNPKAPSAAVTTSASSATGYYPMDHYRWSMGYAASYAIT